MSNTSTNHPRRFNFTAAGIEALPIPPSPTRTFYTDSKREMLEILVSHTGKKTFYCYQYVRRPGMGSGTTTRVRIGRFPVWNVDKARIKAMELSLAIEAGHNPNKLNQDLRAETTLGELFEEYMTKYSRTEKRSWEYDQREIPKFLGLWFDRKLSTISQTDVEDLHLTITAQNGPYQANRVLERLRAMYNKKIKKWGWVGTNPTAGVSKNVEIQRDRILGAGEVDKFFKAVEAEDELYRDFILILLWTWQRKGNVLAMRWDEIDAVDKSWRIPLTKNGSPHTVALTSEAWEILRRRSLCQTSEWVFPSKTGTGHITDPRKVWNRIRKTAGLQTLRLHDLRRTGASYASMVGANVYLVAQNMGHKDPATTKRYTTGHSDAVRAIAEKGNARLASFRLQVPEYDKV